MVALLTIGEFARATHLSVKTLRHYDEIGLLRPAEVDASSGYRRYATAQVPIAHVIRRFRELSMPLDEVRSVLDAPDIEARDRTIVAHLERMQETLEKTQATVASLKAMLDGRGEPVPVELRSVPPTPAVAVRADLTWGDAAGWLGDAFGVLHRALASAPAARADVDTALFAPAFYETHAGEVTACIPIGAALDVTGPVELVEIPAAHLAVTVHCGPFDEVDQAYGALGTFVAENILGADGPLRERYLVTTADTDDPSALRTEVAWPIRDLPAPTARRAR